MTTPIDNGSSWNPYASYQPEDGSFTCDGAPRNVNTAPAAPADHPALGVPLHCFAATGEVSWECMTDCMGAQVLPLTADIGGTAVAAVAVEAASATPAGAIVAGATALITVGLCYAACSDLEGLAPPKPKPESLECKDWPDASVPSDASK